MNRSPLKPARRTRIVTALGAASAIAVLALVFRPDSAIPQASGGGQQQQQQQQQGGGTLEDGIKGFWEVELPGGRFVVQLGTISSVSEHQYLMDGGVRVYEVTVDTTGSQAARFYYLEAATEGSPLSMAKTALDRAKSLATTATDRTGTSEVWNQVVKTYPDTTHARTAEFRLQNRAVLTQIYNHIHRVWAQERGRGQKNKLRIVNE